MKNGDCSQDNQDTEKNAGKSCVGCRRKTHAESNPGRGEGIHNISHAHAQQEESWEKERGPHLVERPALICVAWEQSPEGDFRRTTVSVATRLAPEMEKCRGESTSVRMGMVLGTKASTMEAVARRSGVEGRGTGSAAPAAVKTGMRGEVVRR